MNKKIILSALFISLCFSVVFGQEKAADLKNRKITISAKNKTLNEIFCHLIIKYGVPIGFEGSTLDNDHTDYVFRTILSPADPVSTAINDSDIRMERLFTINAKDAALEEVLDQIVGLMKNYQWEINDEVVNIFPIKGRDARYEKLLSLRISSFSIEKRSPVGAIRNTIFTLPEVNGFLADNKIHFNNSRPLNQNLLRVVPQEMKFSDLTLRDLLNKITKVKKGGWYLRKNFLFGSDTEEYIEIDI